ncbi:MAG: 3-oxoacyl-[acyl-carrier protein] reductase [Alphaproteobacteria bacterium]|nr:3-oxoacyl-[acyl-carrier protein] reductase [Alphaproteobacteria bacterium]
MDLGISGKQALVCAASKGLGKACALHLAREGAHVTITARTLRDLEAAASDIQAQTGMKVTIAPGDMATEDGRNAALAACPQPDILVNNCGGPPPGDFRQLTREDWISAFDANMMSAIELMKATVDGMMARKFGRIINITSASVKNPIGMLPLSNGIRAGLTGFVAGLSRDTVRHNVTINCLLPGAHDTDRLRSAYVGRAKSAGIDIEELIARDSAGSPAGRVGTADEFGAACAFFCSQYAGFITGQNLVLDGGAYRGML